MFTNNVKDAVEATLHLGFTPAGLPVALDFIDLPESLRHKYQYYTGADLTRSDGSCRGAL